MDGGQLKNVCLLSVCCLSVVCDEFVPNYLLNPWSDWAKLFFTKTRENVYLRFELQFLSNRLKKYIFSKINLFSWALSRRNFDFLP